jgi:hypothetical protein
VFSESEGKLEGLLNPKSRSFCIWSLSCHLCAKVQPLKLISHDQIAASLKVRNFKNVNLICFSHNVEQIFKVTLEEGIEFLLKMAPIEKFAKHEYKT